MDIWEHLTLFLKQFYATYGVLEFFKKDAKYLEKAFIHIEQLWENQFHHIKQINYVLLGEAPFYGESKSYFYNEQSKYTPFFRHEIYPTVKSTSLNKQDLFLHLRDNGFIILDIFPFALNEKTAINYKKNIKNKKAIELFNAISDFHFVPKLKKIKTKSTKKTVFSFRYKKNKILSDTIKTCLKSQNFITDKTKIKSVASGNMPIDIQALQEQYKNSINDL